MTTEEREIIWEMMDEEDYNPNTACERCPFHERCRAESLFWGCGVWEDQMGEDL